jgi:hypothetical protein
MSANGQFLQALDSGLSLGGWEMDIIGLREQIGQATWGPDGPE